MIRARETIELLSRHSRASPDFIGLEMWPWPPNSSWSDRKPVDYSV